MDALENLRRFGRDEDGAVTVDWVVLAAALVGLGVAVFATLRPQVEAVTTDISDNLSEQTVDTTFGDD